MTQIRWQANGANNCAPQTRDIEQVQRHFRRMFGEFEGGRHEADRHVGSAEGTYIPRVDISDDEQNVYLHAELPGLSAEDVKITVTEGVLSIKGEKKISEKVESPNFIRKERRFGSFVRQFTLADNLSEEIQATFENGLLEIAIPKKEPVKPEEREIKIATNSKTAKSINGNADSKSDSAQG